MKQGDKVVCIRGFKGKIISSDCSEHIGKYVSNPPKKGDILTVAYADNRILIFYEKLFNQFGYYRSFKKKNFRPLDYGFVEEVICRVKPKDQVINL